ncbi:hypothetical protein BpHYR1_022830 [Brachionus plicatilis]|uniref:Uncharacterized protein n=1 Tax=Brachionus plicatilis TaxID=10195 RepID=A0A3M7QHA7_BRAPC|nr:hypothetical protein BpHYR1_022830 [Brachionus plicatilis]
MCNVQGATIGDLLVGHFRKLVLLVKYYISKPPIKGIITKKKYKKETNFSLKKDNLNDDIKILVENKNHYVKHSKITFASPDAIKLRS